MPQFQTAKITILGTEGDVAANFDHKVHKGKFRYGGLAKKFHPEFVKAIREAIVRLTVNDQPTDESPVTVTLNHQSRTFTLVVVRAN